VCISPQLRDMILEGGKDELPVGIQNRKIEAPKLYINLLLEPVPDEKYKNYRRKIPNERDGAIQGAKYSGS